MLTTIRCLLFYLLMNERLLRRSINTLKFCVFIDRRRNRSFINMSPTIRANTFKKLIQIFNILFYSSTDIWTDFQSCPLLREKKTKQNDIDCVRWWWTTNCSMDQNNLDASTKKNDKYDPKPPPDHNDADRMIMMTTISACFMTHFRCFHFDVIKNNEHPNTVYIV